MSFIQQGEMMFISIEGVPEGATPVAPDWRRDQRAGYIVGHGESGNAHVLEALPGVELLTLEGRFFARVGLPVVLFHQEHNDVIVAPGDYEIKPVQEFDPITEAMRAVRD